jgi:hypothetical protein
MAVALALGALAATSWARGGERPFRIVTVAGQAEVQAANGARWNAATLRAELEPGSAARTLAGRLTLTTPSGQAVRLAPSSRVALSEAGGSDQPTRVRLDAGSVWAAVMSESSADQRLQIQTGGVTVTVRGSGVGVTLARDGMTVVRVYHGSAECVGSGPEGRWSRTLAQDQELSVSGSGTPAATAKLKRDKVDAAWIKWNEEQDAAGGYGAPRPAR